MENHQDSFLEPNQYKKTQENPQVELKAPILLEEEKSKSLVPKEQLDKSDDYITRVLTASKKNKRYELQSQLKKSDLEDIPETELSSRSPPK